MDISQFNPGMELKEKNHLSVSRTRKEPGVVCQMPKMFIFSDELPFCNDADRGPKGRRNYDAGE